MKQNYKKLFERIYHDLIPRTEKVINDKFFASETYFTEDIEVSKEYGQIIYKLEVEKEKINCFEKDCFNEHWISRCLIPIHLFERI